MKKKKEILSAYEKRNEEIVNMVIKGMTVREARIEMNKNLGNVLVKLSDLKSPTTN